MKSDGRLKRLLIRRARRPATTRLDWPRFSGSSHSQHLNLVLVLKSNTTRLTETTLETVFKPTDIFLKEYELLLHVQIIVHA